MTDATDYPLFDHVLHNLRSAILDIAHQPSRASESAFAGVERHQEWLLATSAYDSFQRSVDENIVITEQSAWYIPISTERDTVRTVPMTFIRRERQDLDTNLTPLIDVVFLLLTFCMAFTTFRRESDVAINLLVATAEASASRATLIEISISTSSVRAINLVAFVNARLDTLVSALQKVSGGSSVQAFVIAADANKSHQLVATDMDAAEQIGFNTLSTPTKNVVEN